MRRYHAVALLTLATAVGSAPALNAQEQAGANAPRLVPRHEFAAGKKHTESHTRPVQHSHRYYVMQRASNRCDQTHVRACIRYAAEKYRQPYEDALRVANCESGMDPYNSYAGHDGLYQFLYPSTWNTTPYSGQDVWSARYNSLAAMWMWSVGRRGEWQCQ